MSFQEAEEQRRAKAEASAPVLAAESFAAESAVSASTSADDPVRPSFVSATKFKKNRMAALPLLPSQHSGSLSPFRPLPPVLQAVMEARKKAREEAQRLKVAEEMQKSKDREMRLREKRKQQEKEMEERNRKAGKPLLTAGGPGKYAPTAGDPLIALLLPFLPVPVAVLEQNRAVQIIRHCQLPRASTCAEGIRTPDARPPACSSSSSAAPSAWLRSGRRPSLRRQPSAATPLTLRRVSAHRRCVAVPAPPSLRHAPPCPAASARCLTASAVVPRIRRSAHAFSSPQGITGELSTFWGSVANPPLAAASLAGVVFAVRILDPGRDELPAWHLALRIRIGRFDNDACALPGGELSSSFAIFFLPLASFYFHSVPPPLRPFRSASSTMSPPSPCSTSSSRLRSSSWASHPQASSRCSTQRSRRTLQRRSSRRGRRRAERLATQCAGLRLGLRWRAYRRRRASAFASE